MNSREHIISTLRATGRDNIDSVINYMEEHGFFTAHCCRHHHYIGGLADHSWQTYQFALRGAEEYERQHPFAEPISRSSLALAAILHDFCDCTGMLHIHHHGQRSAQMLKELGLHLTQDEFLAIRFHMSLWNKKSHFLYPDACKCQLRSIVHASDGQSAREGKGFEIE